MQNSNNNSEEKYWLTLNPFSIPAIKAKNKIA